MKRAQKYFNKLFLLKLEKCFVFIFLKRGLSLFGARSSHGQWKLYSEVLFHAELTGGETFHLNIPWSDKNDHAYQDQYNHYNQCIPFCICSGAYKWERVGQFLGRRSEIAAQDMIRFFGDHKFPHKKYAHKKNQKL